MAESTNSYTILGITKGASDKEVKNAYVNLVKKYDPEKHTDRFMIIQQAYDRLRQTKTRAKEDVHSFNMAIGEYLFQEGERTVGDEPPSESEIARARAKYTENSLDEWSKTNLAKLLFQRAHYASTRKQLADAIRDWGEILEMDPSHMRARHNLEIACSSLGISYALHGLHEEAMELIERALQFNPDDTNLIHNLALLAEKAGDAARAGQYWGETVNRWKAKLAQEPDNEYLRQCLIEALNHHGSYMEAYRTANLGKSAKPAPAPIRLKGAATASQSAVPLPSNPSVKMPARGMSSDSVALPQQQSASAPSMAPIERFREILKLNPDDFEAHFQLANGLMEEKKYPEALKELAALAAKHPKNTEVLNMMGWAQLNNGQKDEAFNSWKRSLMIDPKNGQTREQLVKAHLQMGKAFRSKGVFTQALVHFKSLLSLMPKSAEVYLEIAATYDMKGDVRSAADSYRAVIEIDPKNKVARKALNDLRMK
ncbi:tetratricopeptide repeat protein [Candidatus Sumerlaeota bacterium]|nr:tetratricopeptide repeat protein [Candidatus Sumerlaeota bacterium]